MSRQLHSRDRVTINCCKKRFKEDTFLAKKIMLDYFSSLYYTIIYMYKKGRDILSENGFIDRSMFTQ